MAAGLVALDIKDGDGTIRTAQFWSSTGLATGLLYSPAIIVDSTGAVIDFSTPSPVTQSGTWAGVGVKQDAKALISGSTSSAVTRLPINLTATGDLVSLVASNIISVVDFAIVCSAAMTVTFTSGTGGGISSITGPMSFAANGGIAAGFCATGHFATLAGEKLAMTISGSGTVAGYFSYVTFT